MSVDHLLDKLAFRTLSSGRRPLQAHAAESALAKLLIETLGSYKLAHPQITDEVVADAVRTVLKCIDENDGAIN